MVANPGEVIMAILTLPVPSLVCPQSSVPVCSPDISELERVMFPLGLSPFASPS